MFSSLLRKRRPVERIVRWGRAVCGSPPHLTSGGRILWISVRLVNVMHREKSIDPVGVVVVVPASLI